VTGRFFNFAFEYESCSALGLLRTTLHGSPLKTKVRPWGTAVIGSARPGMFVLAGGVDGGGVGVGVRSQHGVVLGAEHVEQSTVSTECA
jgi:hypothetical protein